MADFDDDEYESFDLDGSDDEADQSEGSTDDSAGSEVQAAADDADDDDDDDDEDFDDDDDLDDAAEDEIDFVLAAYREDGQPVVQELDKDLANDLDELFVQLRRQPGDAGAIGFVSLVEEVFAIVRVRGRNVQVLLSDGGAAADWPIARDIADFLGVDIPDGDEDTEPMGDLGIFSDLGMSDFDMATTCDNLDLGSDQMLIEIADKIKIGPQFRKYAESFRS